MRTSSVWAPLGCLPVSEDEVRLGRELESALGRTRHGSEPDRAAARLRVESITQQLIRRVARTGREHLVSALER